MLSVGFEPATPAIKMPQTYDHLDRHIHTYLHLSKSPLIYELVEKINHGEKGKMGVKSKKLFIYSILVVLRMVKTKGYN